jgi:hypothetical protein
LPKIILDEIKGLYSKEFSSRIAEISKNSKNLNKLIVDKKKHVEIQKFDFEEEIENYITFLKQKLKIKEENIVPYKNEFLPIIAQIAINKEKPSGEKGQGFRDVLIWLTMKNYCAESVEKEVCFISQNTADFAGRDGGNLEESLQNQCDEIGIKINYFSSLKEFIDNHSTKIQFINEEWITERLNFHLIDDLVLDFLNGSENYSVIGWAKNQSGGHCEKYYAESIELYDVDDFKIYEMSDNKIIVNIELSARVKFNLSVVYYERWENDSDFHYSQFDDYSDVVIFASATLEGKEISEIEISDLELLK